MRIYLVFSVLLAHICFFSRYKVVLFLLSDDFSLLCSDISDFSSLEFVNYRRFLININPPTSIVLLVWLSLSPSSSSVTGCFTFIRTAVFILRFFFSEGSIETDSCFLMTGIYSSAVRGCGFSTDCCFLVKIEKFINILIYYKN